MASLFFSSVCLKLPLNLSDKIELIQRKHIILYVTVSGINEVHLVSLQVKACI